MSILEHLFRKHIRISPSTYTMPILLLLVQLTMQDTIYKAISEYTSVSLVQFCLVGGLLFNPLGVREILSSVRTLVIMKLDVYGEATDCHLLRFKMNVSGVLLFLFCLAFWHAVSCLCRLLVSLGFMKN